MTCARVFTQAGRKVPTGSGAVWCIATDINQVVMIPDDTSRPLSSDKKKGTKAERLRDAVRQLFGDELLAKLRGDVDLVEWHEATLQVQNNMIVDLDDNIVREIIWELFEHNFRYEIVALDMVAAPSKWAGEEAAVARKDEIRRVFGILGKFVIWSDPFPRFNEGLQAEDISDRKFVLEDLRRIQKAWPDVSPTITKGCFLDTPRTSEQLEAFEAEVVGFYCQTFFDFFGRPPIVPHRLPLHADYKYQRDIQEQRAAADMLTMLSQS